MSALSNNEEQSNKSQAEEKKTESLQKQSAEDSSVQAQSDQSNATSQGEIETKIKKQHHTGITQQIGLLSESNETAKKYSDVVNQYQQMRSRNLAESGISQAFGSLLPKKSPEEEQKDKEKDKDDDGWSMFKPSDDKK